MVKVMGKNQKNSAMLGYVTKDEGAADGHYQILSHNLTPLELSNGRREHEALRSSYDDGKKVLNIKNLFNEGYKFNMRCMYPAVVPLEYCFLYMLQSGLYILTAEYVSSGRKLDWDEARTLWDIVFNPKETTIDMVFKLLYDRRSYGSRTDCRYYLSNVATHAPPDFAVSSPDTSVTSNSDEMLATKLVNICRNREVSPSSPRHLTEDYEPLPENEVAFGYTLDKEGDISLQTFQCPAHLHDMNLIVAKLREERTNALQLFTFTPPANPPVSSSRRANYPANIMAVIATL
jgi:hypothetical protein